MQAPPNALPFHPVAQISPRRCTPRKSRHLHWEQVSRQWRNDSLRLILQSLCRHVCVCVGGVHMSMCVVGLWVYVYVNNCMNILDSNWHLIQFLHSWCIWQTMLVTHQKLTSFPGVRRTRVLHAFCNQIGGTWDQILHKIWIAVRPDCFPHRVLCNRGKGAGTPDYTGG